MPLHESSANRLGTGIVREQYDGDLLFMNMDDEAPKQSWKERQLVVLLIGDRLLNSHAPCVQLPLTSGHRDGEM